MQQQFDSDFCGSLPLSFINQIQPYGMLWVLDLESLEIVQISQNSSEYLGISHEAIIQNKLSQYTDEETIAQLRSKMSISGEKLPMTLTLAANGTKRVFHALIHHHEEYLVMELEPATAGKDSSFTSVYQEVRYIMAVIKSAATKNEVFNLAVKALKQLSGFDRIMIYEFDELWNGTVVAEVLEEGMDPYLGLRFPASDIPKQARALYLKNPYRLIPDKDFTPVRLYPVINPITQSFIDLSDCNIRSVASVHLEYLGNMGVQSSMSTRLIVNDGLWGLISCHHRTAFHPGYEMCTVFELLSDVIAAKIAALEKETDYRLGEELQSIRSYLAERLYAGTGISDALVKGEQTILDLLNVEGIAMCLDKTIKLFGKTPDEEQTRNLVQWLQLEGAVETQATSSISHLYEGGNQFTDVASGMIILPVRPESGEYIIGFRPEVIQQVNWGGNPNEAIQFEADNKNYHPRHSFSTWQQQVKHTSLPWHQQEIAIAEQFRTMFLQYKYKNQF